ncbi:hypothetical protein HPB47_009418, partial [Ixodes persulcatus]
LCKNPKKFWRLMSPNESSGSVILLDENGDAVPDELTATYLNNYFASVFASEILSDIPLV